MFIWQIAIMVHLFGYGNYLDMICEKFYAWRLSSFLQLYYELIKGHFYEKFLWYGREFRQFPYYIILQK